MTYNNYVSSIFYLAESIKYLDGEIKTRMETQLLALLEQAYAETNVLTFKIFLELKRAIPEVQFYYSVKNSLTKSKTRLVIIRDYERENCPFHIPPEQDIDLKGKQTKFLFQGSLEISYNRYGYASLDNDYFSARDTIQFEFSKYKTYNENEMANLVQEILTQRVFN